MIRLAQPRDAETVQALVNDAYRHWFSRTGRVPGPLKDNYAQRIAAHQLWVLELGGEIVGVVVLVEQPECILLENMAVWPSEQGKGYGHRLIAFAEREAAHRGFPELQLCTSVLMTENIALYQHLGYTEVGRIRGVGYERVCLGKPVQRDVQIGQSRLGDDDREEADG